MKLISIVTPCYNEEENVLELATRVQKVMETELSGYSYEHIFIDNASTDSTVTILRQLASNDKRIKVIVNSRNFGHLKSPTYGILQAQGDVIISIVSDLQDPPEMIPEFISKWEDGNDIVLAIKKSSDENGLMFKIREIYYGLLSKLSEVQIFKNFTGFGLYDKKVIKSLKMMNDPYPFFRGMIAEVGYKVAKLEYNQPVRIKGITKNNFYTLYDIGMLGIMNNSKVPLRMAIFMGIFFGIISLLVGSGYLIAKLLYWDTMSLRVAPLIVMSSLMFSIMLFFIGIIGEYVGAIYTQVLNRPLVFERKELILRIKLYFFGAIVLNLIILAPILMSDYFGDDIFNFQVHGLVPSFYNSIYDLTSYFFDKWMNEIGRFFPGAFYIYYVFWILDDVLYYKFFLLIATMIDLILMSYLVYIISKNSKLSLIFLFITPVIFQFRYYHDPFLSFYALVQVTFAYLIISLILLIIGMNKGKHLFLCISSLFYLFALLTYEISFSFLPIFLIIIWLLNDNKLNKIRISLYYVVVSILVLCLNLYMKFNASASISTYSINFELLRILKAYFFQVIATFPLSYALSVNKFKFFFKELNYIPLIITLMWFFAASLLTYKQKLNNLFCEAIRIKSLYLLSVLLILLPGSLISLSPKYQDQLTIGIGYLPVLIQYFGLSLLFSMIIINLNKQKQLFAFFLLGTILFIHLQNNLDVVSKVNKIIKDRREVLGKYLSSEHFKNIPENSNICFNEWSHIHSKEFINIFTGKKMNVFNNFEECSTKSNSYYINFRIDDNLSLITQSSNQTKMIDYAYYIYDKKWDEVDSEKYPRKFNMEFFGNYDWEFNGQAKFTWIKNDLVMKIISYSNHSENYKLKIEFLSLDNRNLEFIYNNDSIDLNQIHINNKFEHIIQLQEGVNIIKIQSIKEAISPNSYDKRKMSFGIYEPMLMRINE